MARKKKWFEVELKRRVIIERSVWLDVQATDEEAASRKALKEAPDNEKDWSEPKTTDMGVFVGEAQEFEP